MNIIENNVDSLNTIIFQNRNKNYGAYILRSTYGNTIFKSLGITVLIFAFLSSIAMMLNRTVDEEKKLDTGSNIIPPTTTTVFDITLPTKHDAILPKHHSDVTPKTDVVSTNINDKADEQKKDMVQSTDAHPKDGMETKNNTDNDNDTDIGGGTGKKGTSIGTETLTNTNTVVMAPEVMPKFDNLSAFLQRNLRYPEMAKDLNIQGKVYVNFIVDEEGKIINATVVRGIGYGCDEEALRVIRLIPKGTPGYMGGKAVKVSFVQAIAFKLQ
jgi:protein TonB